MYTKVRFVFTATDGKAPVTHNDIEEGYFYNPMSILAKHRMGKCTNMHLHIIGDGDVKLGETYYNLATNSMIVMGEEAKEAEEFAPELKQLHKKIIASTDETNYAFPMSHIIPVDLIHYCIRLSNKGFPNAEIEIESERVFDKPEGSDCDTCLSFISKACREGCGTISCYGTKDLKHKYWKPKNYFTIPATPKTEDHKLLFKKDKVCWSEEELVDKCKKILWDYIKGSPDLRGTDFDGGLSTSIKWYKDVNIDNWVNKNL